MVRKLFTLALFALAFTLADHGWAGTTFHQDVACTSTASTEKIQNVAVVTLKPRQIIYNCHTGDSNMIFLSTEATLEYDPGDDSTGTDTSTIYLYRCSRNTVDVNVCEKVLYDNDGDGVIDDDPLNGNPGDDTVAEQRRFIYDLPPGYYFIKSIATGGNAPVATFTSKEW